MQCFYEDPNYRAFTNDFTTKVGVADNNFTGSCIEMCQYEGYAYAAVHTGYQKLTSPGGNAAYHHNMYPANQCHCGYVQGLYGQPSNSICQTPCSDDDAIKYYNSIAGGNSEGEASGRARQCKKNSRRGNKGSKKNYGALTSSNKKKLQSLECIMPCGKSWSKKMTTSDGSKCKSHKNCNSKGYCEISSKTSGQYCGSLPIAEGRGGAEGRWINLVTSFI